MSQYLLAIDQGTTGTTALLIDEKLQVLAKVNHEFVQHYPQPGWVEHDPADIWSSTCKVIADCIAAAKLDAQKIAAIGIANQRETTVLWERSTGRPVYNAIVWQDRRTADRCEELKKQNLGKKLQQKTGLVCDPYFSATKIEWLLNNTAKDDLAFGNINTLLLWQLTAGKVHATDVGNASRTMLMDLQSCEWDDDLLDLFNVPKNILPRIVSNSEHYGVTKNVPGLPDGIPICGMAGDQQAALIGQACFEAGEAKCTYGTGSFILVNIGENPLASSCGCLTTVAYQLNGKTIYAWEGSAFIAGAAVQWLRDGLGLIKASHEVESLSAQVEDSGGVVFVPALTGLGAPYWNPDAKGVIHGINRGTTAAHIARATLEGIAFCQYDILQAMRKDLGEPLQILKVDGGAAANNLLMQFQSDILQTKLSRPQLLETTALGAAFLAGLGIGVWDNLEDIKNVWQEERAFAPQLSEEAIKAKLQLWQSAVQKA